MSPIEQSIKSKIEAVGVPLKDWDISINYGIKTGFNDAFIISKEKREEILSNCKTSEERAKTDEIIRPILRGRDIKRYGYDFADLWLINTHNGIKEKGIPKIDVEKDFPAIKKHLDEYWKKEQTKVILHTICVTVLIWRNSFSQKLYGKELDQFYVFLMTTQDVLH